MLLCSPYVCLPLEALWIEQAGVCGTLQEGLQSERSERARAVQDRETAQQMAQQRESSLQQVQLTLSLGPCALQPSGDWPTRACGDK